MEEELLYKHWRKNLIQNTKNNKKDETVSKEQRKINQTVISKFSEDFTATKDKDNRR